MHTFEKDGLKITYNGNLSGDIYLQWGLTDPFKSLPPGFLKAWLSHAGYMLVPKESMAGGIASILATYDGDKVVRELQEFIDEDDTTEGNNEEGDQ